MALKGIKVIEFMGLAPGPLCGTILADFGASVTVIQRVGTCFMKLDSGQWNSLFDKFIKRLTLSNRNASNYYTYSKQNSNVFYCV